jgi:hypothetical protein
MLDQRRPAARIVPVLALRRGLSRDAYIALGNRARLIRDNHIRPAFLARHAEQMRHHVLHVAHARLGGLVIAFGEWL